MRSTVLALFASLLTLSALAPQAHADYVVYVYQNGPNVEASGSGTIDTAVGADGNGTSCGSPLISGEDGILCNVAGSTRFTLLVSGPDSFGSGPVTLASSSSGDFVGLVGFFRALAIPNNYVSGDALSGTDIWDNTTLSGLGLTTGTYTWTWGSTANGDADSYVMNIGEAPPVPEPSSVFLLGAAGGISFLLFRRRKRAV